MRPTKWDLDYDRTPFPADRSAAAHTLSGLDGPAERPVALRVTDNRGGTSIATQALVVDEVAPTLNVSFPATRAEGQTGILNASATDPGPDAVRSWYVDWGDGRSRTFTMSGFSTSFAYDENGTYTITGTATDEEGTYAFAPITVTVSNAAPVASAGTWGGYRQEGRSEHFVGSFTDAGRQDTHTAAWAIRRSGSTEVLYTTTQAIFDYVFDDNGTYVATYTVTDDDGGVGSASTTVTVTTVAPSGALSYPSSVPEGGMAEIGLTNVYDPSAADTAAGFRYSFDFDGDNLYEVLNATTASATVPASYLAEGPLRRYFNVRVADKDGTSHTYGGSILVTNVAPTVAITGGPASDAVNEGTALSYTLAATDPSTADNNGAFSYAWSVTRDGAAFLSGTTKTINFTPGDEGTYVITATATDRQGAQSAPAQRTVAVANVAPTAVFNTNAAYVVEGQAVPIRFDGVRDAQGDMNEGLLYSYDFNGDGDFTDPGDILDDPGPVEFYAFPEEGTYHLRGRIADRDGGSSEYALTLIALADAPDVTIQGPTTARRNQSTWFRFIASDTGTFDQQSSFTYSIDWTGDGVVDQTLVGPGLVDTSYTYKRSGTYQIGVTARDKDGVTGPTAYFTVEVGSDTTTSLRVPTIYTTGDGGGTRRRAKG